MGCKLQSFDCIAIDWQDQGRDGLGLLLTKARKGDHIVITKIDRLGRSTADMIRIIKDIGERGVTGEFPCDGISTKVQNGDYQLAAIAQAARERIMERSNEGS